MKLDGTSNSNGRCIMSWTIFATSLVILVSYPWIAWAAEVADVAPGSCLVVSGYAVHYSVYGLCGLGHFLFGDMIVAIMLACYCPLLICSSFAAFSGKSWAWLFILPFILCWIFFPPRCPSQCSGCSLLASSCC